MPPAAPKTTRVSDAYDRLKAEILLGRMPPGFQAPEPEIALRLGMSRTPVREALIRLEAEGLVQLIPRRGARVLPVRAEDMREIYAILTALEPEAAAVLAESGAKAEDLAALEVAVAEMEAALAAQDLDRWAARACQWAEGGIPADLSSVDPAQTPDKRPRDVFVYFIHEGKLRAPAAAMSLIERLA